MKISEMENVLDIWYQRAKKLSNFSQNTNDLIKQQRSFELSFLLFRRVINGLNEIQKIKSKYMQNFESGGIVSNNSNQSVFCTGERII